MNNTVLDTGKRSSEPDAGPKGSALAASEMISKSFSTETLIKNIHTIGLTIGLALYVHSALLQKIEKDRDNAKYYILKNVLFLTLGVFSGVAFKLYYSMPVEENKTTPDEPVPPGTPSFSSSSSLQGRFFRKTSPKDPQAVPQTQSKDPLRL